MFRLTKRKERIDNLRKRHLIQNWLSSFIVTTVVVVTQIITPSSEPVVKFDRIGTINESIYYEVNVIDQSDTFNPDSLKLIVENQYDYNEVYLKERSNSGVVSNLKENTIYDVKVVASKGYGMEVLAQEKLKTSQTTGGAIVSVELINDDMAGDMLYYDVRTIYTDDISFYHSYNLKYCILFHEMNEQIPDTCIDYVDNEITGQDQVTAIDIPNNNVSVFLIFEAIDSTSDEVVILDTLEFKTPLNVGGYLYINDVTDHSISISSYVDYDLTADIQYKLDLYQENQYVKTIDLVRPISSDHSNLDSSVIFGDLENNTVYTVKLITQYHDEFTEKLIIKEVMSETVATSPPYLITVTVTENESFYFVEIDIDDEYHILINFTYYIYDMSGEYPIYVSDNLIEINEINQRFKYTSFEVMIPAISEYQIVFVCDKIIGDSTIYYSSVFYEINHYGG